MIIASSSSSVPGIWISRGSLSASLMSSGSRCSRLHHVRPWPRGIGKLEDRLRVAVARVDRQQHRLALVDAVDAEVVVPDHALQAVGDDLEDAGGVERGQQAAVDLEQASLRVGLAGERGGLLAELLVQARVRDLRSPPGWRGPRAARRRPRRRRRAPASATVSEPMAPCSPMSGALITERMPCWRM